jgi:hypothetical protein
MNDDAFSPQWKDNFRFVSKPEVIRSHHQEISPEKSASVYQRNRQQVNPTFQFSQRW